VQTTLKISNNVNQRVQVTHRDGKQTIGTIRVTDSHNYPFSLVSTTIPQDRDQLTYTESGQVLMFNESDEDIVSIRPVAKSTKKMKSNSHLLTYLDRRVRVTFRDGSKALGSIYRSDSGEDYPFVFMPEGDDPSETYTADGQVYVREEDKKDILAIEILDPVDGDEKDSAVEKMALALLPAVFTSLESDPNLDLAIEIAIRGTFLAMFGDDVTGETLNHSVSVIKSRICLSLKQC
jgi:small nuclear ribonucleoprotein (snRNP)-like protein